MEYGERQGREDAVFISCEQKLLSVSFLLTQHLDRWILLNELLVLITDM